jgi:HEAT repeat protein
LAKGLASHVSSNFSTFRFVFRASGWLLSLPLLCGCFSHGVVPIQPVPPAQDHDSSVKGQTGALKPTSANAETAATENAKPADTRGLLLRGGWYRIPFTAEESATAIYVLSAGSGDRADSGSGSGEPTVSYRYRHAGLEQLMARPAEQRTALAALLNDSDRNVEVAAAIAIARQGDVKAAPYLIAAIEDAKQRLPLPARCAAAEALGQLPGDDQTATLQRLVDRYGQFLPGASTDYQADLHAELLRALARHIDPGDDPRFIAAGQIPFAQVRIEALRAWAAGGAPAQRVGGVLPSEIVDLRSDDDSRVRAAALTALAARKHPAARDFLTEALRDVDLAVRLAAVRGLGRLDDAKARVTLADLLKDRSELIRAEAVTAIAGYPRAGGGSQAVVLSAAGDPSWRVRLKVADALAGYRDGEGAATARRLLDDPSGEVERQVVRALAAWPWEAAGPVLLEALGKNAVTVRKAAAEQLAARWPAAGRFPFDAPPSRRAEALAELQTRYQREFGDKPIELAPPAAPQATPVASDAEVERLLAAGDFRALTEIGPTVVSALERLAIERKLTLPEPVYHDVLPRHSAVFSSLDRLRGGNVDQRRRAAEEVAVAAAKQPLDPLAEARLCALATGETDAAVWLGVLDALRESASEPAIRTARLALGQAGGEVRRRACEYLAAHPDPAHEVFLVPMLRDSELAVVVAAIRALGAAGRIQDIEVLKRLLASTNEEIQLATAIALMQLHDKSGAEAIERMSYSSDVQTRARVAQALGVLADIRLAGILIRLLDDPKATVSHAALASLPKVVGRDLDQSGDGATASMPEQMARWKKWYAEGPR